MPSQQPLINTEEYSGGPRRRPDRQARLAIHASQVAPYARRPDQFASSSTPTVSHGLGDLARAHSAQPMPVSSDMGLDFGMFAETPPRDDSPLEDSMDINYSRTNTLFTRFKIDSALQRAGVEDLNRQSQFRAICEEGIHSLLLFLGARAVKIDERLDRLEQYDVQHQQELKKVQVTLAENFSVGDALKLVLQNLCNHLTTQPLTSYRELAAMAEVEVWRNPGRYSLQAFADNHVVHKKVRDALNSTATESRSKLHKLIKSWATDKVAVRVKDMAQEWYDEHNLNKQDLDAPTSLTAFFSLLRRVKRDAVNAEGASFWTSIDEVLAARVKEFGSNRSVFTSGWTRWHQDEILQEQALESDFPDVSPPKRTKPRRPRKSAGNAGVSSLAPGVIEASASSTSTDSDGRGPLTSGAAPAAASSPATTEPRGPTLVHESAPATVTSAPASASARPGPTLASSSIFAPSATPERPDIFPGEPGGALGVAPGVSFGPYNLSTSEHAPNRQPPIPGLSPEHGLPRHFSTNGLDAIQLGQFGSADPPTLTPGTRASLPSLAAMLTEPHGTTRTAPAPGWATSSLPPPRSLPHPHLISANEPMQPGLEHNGWFHSASQYR